MHLVGNLKKLFSCRKLNFSDDLIDAYAQMIEPLCQMVFETFYGYDRGETGIDLKVDESTMKVIEKAVKTNTTRIV